MKRAEHSSTFSAFAPARAKFVILGLSNPHFEGLLTQVRSLNLEHVSPALLVQQEISRRTPTGQLAVSAFSRGPAAHDQVQLAIFRKWFWARKPDAGFLLEGFPATLLQALVFDEWLEARGESLTGCFSADVQSADPVVTYYRTQALLRGELYAAA